MDLPLRIHYIGGLQRADDDRISKYLGASYAVAVNCTMLLLRKHHPALPATMLLHARRVWRIGSLYAQQLLVSSPSCEVISEIRLCQSMRIHSRNNSAKFHPHRIWNDRILSFLVAVAQEENKNKTKRWVAIWDQVPDPKITAQITVLQESLELLSLAMPFVQYTLHIQGGPKKSKPDNFCNNFVNCQPIFVIFGVCTL